MSDLRAQFVEGMNRALTFVAVATTDGEAGRYGVTISSLTSVSADGDHPSLLACIHHLSPAATAILKNRAFCANLLGEGQQGLSDLLAGRDKSGTKKSGGDKSGGDKSGGDKPGLADRFDRAAWHRGEVGQPVLAGATAAFECRLATAVLWETHYIIVGKVVSVTLSDDPSALLYGQRAYRKAVQLPD